MTTMSTSLRTSPSTITLSYSQIQNPDGTSIDATLLSPPITPLTERDTPFKPIDSDNISLNMKKRHGNKRHHPRPSSSQIRALSNNAINHRDNVPDIGFAYTPRSRSMPSLDRHVSYNTLDDSRSVRDNIPKLSTSAQSRRWTLPSKAHPTKGLTTLKSVVKQQAPTRKTNMESSPAFITLRRATLKPPRQTNLTFFPPPTFSRTKSSFISYFLKSITGNLEHTTENIDFLVNEVKHDGSDRSPRLITSTQPPSLSAMAEPLMTEVLSDVFIANTDTDRRRRCSTRYVSGASVYEVIWDENDSPSNASDSPPPLNVSSEMTQMGDRPTKRRESAAMNKLETQLFRAIAQSRRESYISQHNDSAPRRQSFQSLINMKFSRLFNEAALHNLPRSRASESSKRSNSVSASTDAAVQWTLDDESRVSPQDDMEFFPPLRPCSSTNTSSSTINHTTDQTNRRVSFQEGRKRMGSMLGASSHVRRLSWRNDGNSKVEDGVHSNRKSSHGFMLSNQIMSEETRPLLNGSSWEGENAW